MPGIQTASVFGTLGLDKRPELVHRQGRTLTEGDACPQELTLREAYGQSRTRPYSSGRVLLPSPGREKSPSDPAVSADLVETVRPQTEGQAHKQARS